MEKYNTREEAIAAGITGEDYPICYFYSMKDAMSIAQKIKPGLENTYFSEKCEVLHSEPMGGYFLRAYINENRPNMEEVKEALKELGIELAIINDEGKIVWEHADRRPN